MLEIIDPKNRTLLPSVTLQSGLRCVAAEAGQEYAIRIRSTRRVEAVISVDGRDVLTNEPASPLRPGYVVEDQIIVEGFRVSSSAVRRFVVAELGFHRTTAERNNSADAAGIIACAIYLSQEAHRERYGSGLESFDGLEAMPLRGSSVGTAAGAEVGSRVRQVAFQRSAAAPHIEQIEYDTFESWARRGVIIPRLNAASPWPGASGMAFADPSRL